MTTDKLTNAQSLTIAREIANKLGERRNGVIRLIRRIVSQCGEDFAREMYAATAEIEANGGMMLPDNSRRRTQGGIFFKLVRAKLDNNERNKVFYGIAAVGVPLMSWTDRIGIVQALQSEQGVIESMRISLRGRPGRIEKRPEVIVTTMSYLPVVDNLPRGIPKPPSTPTTFAVYVAPKQWEKVEAAIADPADTLLVEGICAFDPDTQSMAVFATEVQTEQLLAKTRAAQSKADKPVRAKKSPVVAPINPNLPPDVARKLGELQASAGIFRQKVATILSKPAGQQFGLEMTQKLLKNVEAEIAALEQKYAG